MRHMSRMPGVVVAVVILVTTMFLAPSSPIAPHRLAEAAGTALKVNGPAACSTQECHGAAVPKGEGRTVHNEHTLWIKNDKHYKAYANLGSAKGWEIASKMKIEGDPRKAERCLTCHTLHVPKDQQGEKYDPADGVSCDGCHGPSEKYLEPHSKSRPEHKGWTRAQSLAAGMTDTLDPAARADICVKCHLQIDHEMVEAGHPYMTFELDAFSVQLPPHWVREKPFTATKAWAAGQAVALRDSLKQLGVRVEKNAPEKYIANALKIAFAYYTTVRPVAELVDAGAFGPIGTELQWLGTSAGATREKVMAAASPDFQARLSALAKTLGAFEYTADINKKLMLKYVTCTSAVEEMGLNSAEQVFFALDSLFRPYGMTVKPKNVAEIGEAMDKLEQSLQKNKDFKAEEFTALLADLGKKLQ